MGDVKTQKECLMASVPIHLATPWRVQVDAWFWNKKLLRSIIVESAEFFSVEIQFNGSKFNLFFYKHGTRAEELADPFQKESTICQLNDILFDLFKSQYLSRTKLYMWLISSMIWSKIPSHKRWLSQQVRTLKCLWETYIWRHDSTKIRVNSPSQLFGIPYHLYMTSN